MSKAEIIIISRNGADLTLDCIKSIYKHNDDVDITLVDNCSTDNTIELVSRNFGNVKIIENPENYGYAKAINIGFSHTSNDLVVVSNNDIVFHENTLDPLIKAMQNDSSIGLAGPQQVDAKGEQGLSYGDLPGFSAGIKSAFFIDTTSAEISKSLRKAGVNLNNELKEVGYIDGGLMLISRKAFDSVSGFDEDYFFYTEEADFSYRLKQKGWKVIFQPNARVTHYRGGVSEDQGFSRKNIEMLINSKALYCKKHLSRKEGLFFLKALRFRFRLWLLINSILPKKPSSSLEKIRQKKQLHQLFYDSLREAISVY